MREHAWKVSGNRGEALCSRKRLQIAVLKKRYFHAGRLRPEETEGRVLRTFGFPLMAEIIPETPKAQCPVNGGSGFFISHQVLDEERVKHESMMAMFRRDWTNNGLEAGTYCVLHQVRNGYVKQWMSDTWLERMSNSEFLRDAFGDVLLAGLGIGMLPMALCAKEQVRSVVVLELEPHVIGLVEPHIRHPKLTVLLADAYHEPLRGKAFDCIYLDIWQSICSDNWEQMKPLLAQYRKFRRAGGICTGWLKDYVQQEHNNAKRQSYW